MLYAVGLYVNVRIFSSPFEIIEQCEISLPGPHLGQSFIMLLLYVGMWAERIGLLWWLKIVRRTQSLLAIMCFSRIRTRFLLIPHQRNLHYFAYNPAHDGFGTGNFRRIVIEH
jgi:hypothetical protein